MRALEMAASLVPPLLGGVALTPMVWLAHFGLDRRGAATAAYLLGYGALRFWLDRYRERDQHAWRGLSTWQWVSLGLMAAGAAMTLVEQPAVALGPILRPMGPGVWADMATYGCWSFLVLFVAYGVHVRRVGRWM